MYLAPLDEYIVDFYCKDLLLAIEVDDRRHDFKRDRDGDRQRRLESLGIRFLRFWDMRSRMMWDLWCVRFRIGSGNIRVNLSNRRIVILSERSKNPPLTPPRVGTD